MLLASGLLSDWLHGFKMMGQKENTFSKIELLKTEIALKYSFVLFILSGLIGTLIGIISLLSHLDNPSMLGKSLAAGLITLLYSMLLSFILIPIRAKVRAIINTLD